MEESPRYKVIMIGDVNVGKTCLVCRFLGKPLADAAGPTIVVEFVDKLVTLPNKQNVWVDLWDTAGSERYRSLVRNHYAQAAGVVLVYSLTDRKSFESCQYWWDEVQTHCGTEPCVLLVGNKLDLVGKSDANRAVPAERAQKFAKENNMLYIETSAVTHQNVKEAFLMLLAAAARRSAASAPPTALRLEASRKTRLKPRCCR